MRTNKLYPLFGLLVIVAFVLSACGTAATPTEAPAPADTVAAPAATVAPAATTAPSVMDTLAASCKQEGMLTLIATPRSWANYGEIFDYFEKVSGVKINSLDENAGSADELAAIEANKGNKGPQAPDIVDVGYAYGPQAKDAGQVQPYKVSTWDAIPEKILGLPAKDP